MIEPPLYCTTEERVCLGLDGGKWMCHPRVLLTRPGEQCVVYSFGSKAEFSFELEVLEIAPECEIHVFDPTPGLQNAVNRIDLPPQIHFHNDYGLAVEGTSEISIRGKSVKVKSLGAIMTELGHSYIHQLKIDIEGGEKLPGFVDTSSDSPWRKVATLQIEIHGRSMGHRMETLDLLRDLETVGFKLYHLEPNYIFPAMGEYSFISPSQMTKYLSIPYTQDQIEDARVESIRRVTTARGYGNFKVLNAFAKTEKTHFGCGLLRRIPGQLSRVICETFLDNSGGKQDGGRPVIYIFNDTLDAGGEPWITAFASKYDLEIHLWGKKPPSQATMGHVTFHPLSETEGLGNLLTEGMVKLMRQYRHTEVAVVMLSLDTTLATALSAVSKHDETGFLRLSSKLSKPVQLILEIKACSKAEKEVADLESLLLGLPDDGFSLLGKSLLGFSVACHFTFTFAN